MVFGIADVGIMLPMSLPDKTAALTAAFIARFGIGFVIGAARLPWPGWLIGLGAVGGTIIGVIVARFGS